MSEQDKSFANLGEYLLDELQEFAKHHQLTLDDAGFVVGDVLPTDVLSLGYRLLAWTLVYKTEEGFIKIEG